MIRKNKPLYVIERMIINTDELFGDGEHIVYVNGADKVRYLKEDEKGVATMCKAMEDMRNEAVERDRIKNALEMIKDGKLSLEQVAKYSSLALDKVKELASPQLAK